MRSAISSVVRGVGRSLIKIAISFSEVTWTTNTAANWTTNTGQNWTANLED